MNTLPLEARQQIAALKAGWMYVGSAYQDANPNCDNCPHNRVYSDDERYGDGWCQRTYSECDLGERAGDMPTDCPAYREHLQEPAEPDMEPTEESHEA